MPFTAPWVTARPTWGDPPAFTPGTSKRRTFSDELPLLSTRTRMSRHRPAGPDVVKNTSRYDRRRSDADRIFNASKLPVPSATGGVRWVVKWLGHDRTS